MGHSDLRFEMEEQPEYYSDGEEFKVLRRGKRAEIEGKLQFRVCYFEKLVI
jgi:hypothetical protein